MLYTDPDAVTAVWNSHRPPARRREEEEAVVAPGKEVEGRGRKEREERSEL